MYINVSKEDLITIYGNIEDLANGECYGNGIQIFLDRAYATLNKILDNNNIKL